MGLLNLDLVIALCQAWLVAMILVMTILRVMSAYRRWKARHHAG